MKNLTSNHQTTRPQTKDRLFIECPANQRRKEEKKRNEKERNAVTETFFSEETKKQEVRSGKARRGGKKGKDDPHLAGKERNNSTIQIN